MDSLGSNSFYICSLHYQLTGKIVQNKHSRGCWQGWIIRLGSFIYAISICLSAACDCVLCENFFVIARFHMISIALYGQLL